MSEPAAIRGTFSDLKTVKTRSVVQMIVEVPIEQAAQIVAAFGFPRPGEEVPVAVARLDPNAIERAAAPLEAKPRRHFNELPLSQQAALRCQDRGFQRFLLEVGRIPFADTDAASKFVRDTCCGGESRAQLDSLERYADEWRSLNVEYEQWAGLVPEVR